MKKIFSFILAILIIIINNAPDYADVDPRSIFTQEEREWLEAHPVITVGPDSNYAPVEFYEDGTYKGLAMDYLTWIGSTYNIEFKYVQYKTWSDIMNALKNHEIQLQTGIIKTPERDKFLSFTAPYSDMPSVLMIRKDFDQPLNNQTLFDYKVGLINDFAVEEYIRNKYAPKYIYEFDNVKTALESLSTGKVDILVLDIGQATYYVQKMGLTNVMITNDVHLDFAIQLSFATTKDNAMLTQIMNKALKTMPNDLQQYYANKWLGIGEFTKFDTKLLITILSIFGTVTVLFLFTSFWLLTLRSKDKQLALVNIQLQEQIHALSEAQQQLVESEKINALSRLAIGISHEINTPLGNGISLTSYIQALTKQMYTKLDNTDGELVQLTLHIEETGNLALQSLQRAAKIIQDFQSVANYQNETSEKEINLSKEIEMIASILSSHETMKSELHLKLQPNIYTVMSSNSLLQILTALMENSYLHAYDKTVGKVDIFLTLVDETVSITFQDYGIGIAELELANIFEPFYSTKRGTEQRLGFGLYNVFNIVTQYLNGKIIVKSHLNTGTSFLIQFPIKRSTD